ncbi:unannotated protein [freshwater metagenome]|uniref:Unannotated protein n=1 Tax=freshwater metagenome TaxID=449393 RepID=A0A6J7R0X1_9ZZZZ
MRLELGRPCERTIRRERLERVQLRLHELRPAVLRCLQRIGQLIGSVGVRPQYDLGIGCTQAARGRGLGFKRQFRHQALHRRIRLELHDELSGGRDDRRDPDRAHAGDRLADEHVGRIHDHGHELRCRLHLDRCPNGRGRHDRWSRRRPRHRPRRWRWRDSDRDRHPSRVRIGIIRSHRFGARRQRRWWWWWWWCPAGPSGDSDAHCHPQRRTDRDASIDRIPRGRRQRIPHRLTPAIPICNEIGRPDSDSSSRCHYVRKSSAHHVKGIVPSGRAVCVGHRTIAVHPNPERDRRNSASPGACPIRSTGSRRQHLR